MLAAGCWLLQRGVAAWVSTDAADGKRVSGGRFAASGATGLDWSRLDEMVVLLFLSLCLLP